MTNELFLQIVGALITIAIALVSAYVIPWLKTKVNAEQIATFNYYLDLAVRCANQIYTPEQWKEKKEYVMNYLTSVVNTKLKLSLTEEDLSNLIEGKVNEIKREIKNV